MGSHGDDVWFVAKLTLEGKIFDVNETAAALLGAAAPSDLVGCDLIRDFVIERDRDRLTRSLTSCITHRRDVVGIEVRYQSVGQALEHTLVANFYPSDRTTDEPAGATMLAQDRKYLKSPLNSPSAARGRLESGARLMNSPATLEAETHSLLVWLQHALSKRHVTPANFQCEQHQIREARDALDDYLRLNFSTKAAPDTRAWESMTEHSEEAVGRYYSSRSVDRAFTVWVETITRKYRMCELMYRAEARWVVVKQSSVLLKLREFQYSMANNQTMGLAARRWQMNSLSRGLQQWAARVIQANIERATAFRVLRRILQVKLHKAFGAWRNGAEGDSRQDRLVGGAVARLMNRLLSRAWQQWRFAYGESQEAGRRLALIKRTVLRMVHRQLALAFMSWASWVIERNEAKTKMLLAVRRMLQAKSLRIFVLWRNQAAEARKQARLMGGALNRMRNMKLSQAWEQWQYWYEDMKRQLALLKRAVMKMLRRKLAMGFVCWRDQAAEARKQARLMGGALNRMRNMKLSQAWEQWQYWYEDMKHQLALLKRAVMKMMHVHLGRAWQTWKDEMARSWKTMIWDGQAARFAARMFARSLKSNFANAWFDWRKGAHSVPRHMEVQAELADDREGELLTELESTKKAKDELAKGFKELLGDRRKGMNESGQELQKLRQQLQEAVAAKEAAEEQTRAKQEEIEDLRPKVASLRKDLELRDKAIEDVRAELGAAEERVGVLAGENEALKRDVPVLREKLEDTTQDRDEWKAQCLQAEAKSEELQALLDETVARLTEKGVRLVEAEEEIERLKRRLGATQAELPDAALLDDLRDQLIKTERQLVDAKEACEVEAAAKDKAEWDRDEWKERFQTEGAAHEQTKMQLRQQEEAAAAAQSQLEQTEAELVASEHANEQLEGRCEELVAEVDSCTAALQEAEEEIERLKRLLCDGPELSDEIEDLRAQLQEAQSRVVELTETSVQLAQQKQVAEAAEVGARKEAAEEVEKRERLQAEMEQVLEKMRALERAMDRERAEALSERLKAAKRAGAAGVMREILRRWIYFEHVRAVIGWRVNSLTARHKRRLKELSEDSLGPNVWEWEQLPNTFAACSVSTSERLEEAIEMEQQEVGPLPLIDGLKQNEFGAQVRFYPFRRLAVDLQHDKNFKIRQMKCFISRKAVTTSGAVAANKPLAMRRTASVV